MIISVASGKGGTGKTTIATNLALSLEENLQFLDCDVEAPNAAVFLKPKIEETKPVFFPFPRLCEQKCNFCGVCGNVCEWNAIAVISMTKRWLFFPQLCHGCGACWHLCPGEALERVEREQGVVEKGKSGKIDFIQGKLTVGQAVAPPVIKAVKKEVDPFRDAIMDVAPGTACPMVEGVQGTDFCLLVTEPTPFGFSDLVLAVSVLEDLGIPHGVVINRSNVGDESIEKYCARNKIPILLHIPLDKKIARAYSEGRPLTEIDPVWKEKFRNLFFRIKERGEKVKR